MSSPGFSGWGGAGDPHPPHQGQQAAEGQGGRLDFLGFPRFGGDFVHQRRPGSAGQVGKWGPAGSPPPAEALLGRPVQPQRHLVVLPGTAVTSTHPALGPGALTRVR